MRQYLPRPAALLLPLLMAAPAWAQTATPMAPSTMTPPSAGAPATAMAPSAGGAKPSAADTSFVLKAGQGGLAEVQMAQLAQQKTQDSTIRKFAQRMIEDHTPANEKLAKIATADGLTPPAEPSAMQQKMMTRLQGLDGAKFDHAYITGQIKAHQTMLKLLEAEAKNGTNPELKAFAEQTEPMIQQHLEMAESDKSSS